jgi:hypothetical protein
VRTITPGAPHRVRITGTDAALLCLLVALAYGGSLAASFQFDDWNVIVDNPGVHSWSAWWQRMPGIRPLLKATYVASWLLEAGPGGFRAFNIALHAVNAMLVLAVVARLLAVVESPAGVIRPAAWFAAAVFALHPAQTESVTYISGRSGALMSLFLLLALMAHLQAGRGSHPRRWTAAALACFVCAFGAKENAWTFPFTLLALELAQPGNRPGRAWRAVAPHFLVLLVLVLGALAIPGYRMLLQVSLETRTALENLITQVDGQFHLLTRPLLLLETNLDPDLPVRTRWTAQLWPRAAVLLGLMIAALWQWRRRPWLGLGIAWYFVQLAATNSVLPRLDVANDRQLYLALIGPAWVLGVLLAGAASRRLALVLGLGIIAALAATTLLRNRDYATEVSLWQATAEASPRKPRVWNNLGYAREIAGDTAGARDAYHAALALDPDYVKARINLSRLETPAAEREPPTPLR